MEINVNPENQLLKSKYDLHKQPEVEFAAKRKLTRTGEKVPQNPMARIQNYLDRFHEITDRENPKEREHGIDAVKRLLHSKHVIKPDEIPEGYFENQRRLARELGHGDIEITKEARNQLTEVIIADQQSSLDKWIDYLSSPDAPYSDGLKYYTLRSILTMGDYDKEKGAFTQRSKGTVKPFPDLNREALAYVLDAIGKKYKGYDIDLSRLEETDTKEFEKLLQNENFPKLYAWAIDKVTPATPEELSATNGRWVKYDQGSDHTSLVGSLQGHGTGWCTAGESTAQAQLQGGDFYVYYSMDRSGKPIIPRIAIRMEEDRIAEIRGIAPDQNLDAGVTQIVEDKLREFPDGELYKKRVHDMRLLTAVEMHVKDNISLTAEELRFLYEVDSSIEGFGYQRDPRIEELRDGRNPDQDMLVIFNCQSSEIARMANQINESTKAYVGPLEPGIFDRIRKYGIEHIYTKFPEGMIRIQDLEIGGKSANELQRQLKQEGINVSSYAEDLLGSRDFTTFSESQSLSTVRLKVSDLGFTGYSTADQIYPKAQELGLDLCPAEVGPHLRLKYKDQPMDELLYIGMKQILDSDGDPNVFGLDRDDDGLWLNGYWARPVNTWVPKDEFVFSLRK
jgi:hypothetical protein